MNDAFYIHAIQVIVRINGANIIELSNKNGKGYN